MIPNKIFINAKSAEQLCDTRNDGKKTITVKTYPSKNDECYVNLTWHDSASEKPQLRKGEPCRDILIRHGSQINVERVVAATVRTADTWKEYVANMRFESWTYCESLL